MGFVFKGSSSENSSLTQTVSLGQYGIDNNDVLSFSGDYKATSNKISGRFLITVTYAKGLGLAKDKIPLPFSVSASFTTAAINIVPDGPVRKISVRVANQSTGGKLIVDNIQLTLQGQP
jgi:hypothetical protein